MRLALAALALLAAPAPALACSCVPPDGDPFARKIAREIAERAAAVGEFEVIAGVDANGRRGELLRPVRLHVGGGEADYRIERQFDLLPDGVTLLRPTTSCETFMREGERLLLVLYPATGEARGGCEGAGSAPSGLHREAGICAHLFVRSPGALAMVVEEARALGRPVAD